MLTRNSPPASSWSQRLVRTGNFRFVLSKRRSHSCNIISVPHNLDVWLYPSRMDHGVDEIIQSSPHSSTFLVRFVHR